MRKYSYILFVACLLISVSASAFEDGSGHYTLPVEEATIRTQGGKDHLFSVEIAATPEEQMQGLMNREKMPEDHGMLFLFPSERNISFWMKDTIMPLDILYIKADGVINHIHKNAVPLDETPLPSNGTILNVLEINGGMADKLGIQAGDTVYHGSFGNSLAP